jgi:hypothetical protein
LSEDAVHDNDTCVDDGADPTKPDGTDGAVVSGVGVVTDTSDEYPLRFPAASTARTR